MRTGISYMGHHNPVHIRADMEEMRALGCDDVLVAAQENDFVYMVGKIRYAPRIAKDYGLRPIVNFWGALNFFGGGQSSQFLLEHPEGFQVNRDGSHSPQGCYVNPVCVGRIKEMIDTVVENGFEALFIDEPTPMRCFCRSCKEKYDATFSGDLDAAGESDIERFRARCVMDYIEDIVQYCRLNHPRFGTLCCLMPCDRALWRAAANVEGLHSLGTDLYWVNDERAVEQMIPFLRELGALCKKANKDHHEWLQVWNVRKGCEDRIREQAEVIIREQPDALYVWAFKGQIGTTEACDDPAASWAKAEDALRAAKQA